MSRLAAALAGAVLLAPRPAAAAPAAEAVMQPFFGATLEIDNLEGWHADRVLAPDHTYRQTGSDGPTSGTWAVEGGKLCTVQDKPAPPPDRAPRYCNLGPGHQLGDKWQDRDPVTGNAIFFALTPGR
ncbi:MAG: hypothetical protein E7812_14995 [Phenylobacterium sp.]|nr:MAG: hypothetical protein E7812_14995 [Phenylobacterium sp.]